MKGQGRSLGAAILGATIATGCAGPQLASESVTGSEISQARRAMAAEAIPAPMDARGAGQTALVRRVEARLRPAAEAVCRRTLGYGECSTRYRKIRVVTKPYDDTINATADIRGEVTMYGGLLRRVGSEDEVAGVLAHEMAHVLLSHNEKGRTNAAVGMVVGGLIIGAIVLGASGQGGCYSQQCQEAQRDLMELGVKAGGAVGSRSYSPEMELEADQLATYIVHEAGYDVDAARKLFIRLTRIERRASRQGRKGLVGFLKTHPTDARRIAHWAAASRNISAGARAPRTKAAVAADRREARRSARCERLHAQYPRCPDWGRSGLPDWGRAQRIGAGICPVWGAGDCPKW